MTEFIKMQRLSKTVRVVIEPWFNGKYKITAQMYDPDYCWGFEINADGWHNTSARFSSTLEGAKRVFDEMAKSEQRFVEIHR